MTAIYQGQQVFFLPGSSLICGFGMTKDLFFPDDIAIFFMQTLILYIKLLSYTGFPIIMDHTGSIYQWEMRTKIIFFSGIIMLLLFSTRMAYARPADSIDNPRVGLVLSGGAAKGLAHIGVLKVLEEAGIRPDYIAGTSIGAIIGGLYSLGYTSENLMTLVDSIDWDKILTDRVPLHKIAMEEKYDYQRYILEFPVVNGKFKLPSGLNEGYQLERLFNDLTWSATGIHDFDRLPIPFHCMAVDILDGQPVELDSGYLSTAIRSSMAIPGAFAPVRKDSMLLVDGGVIRNFPVQEVKDMGADIVIGVYVGFEKDVTPDDLFSLTDVLRRTASMYGVLDSKKQMEKVDLLIQPDMEGIQAYDFMSGRKIAQRGEEATRDVLDSLKQIARQMKFRYNPVEKLQGPDYIYISDVEVNHLDYVDGPFVIGKGGIFPGQYVTKKTLNEAIENIFGTRYFYKVNYRLKKVEGELYKLIYAVKERNPVFIKGALHTDNVQGSGLILNSTFRNFVLPASKVNLTLNIAEQPGIKFSINKYHGKKQYLIGNLFTNWHRSNLPVFFKDEKVGRYIHGMFRGGIGGKYSLNFNQQFGLDMAYESSTIYPDVAAQNISTDVNFDFENYGFGGIALKGYYRMNTHNDLYFPTKGTQLLVSFKRVFKPISKYRIEGNQTLDEQIFRLNLTPFNAFYFHFDHYYDVSRRFSLKLGSSAGIVSNGTPVTNNYALGGVMAYDAIKYEPMAGFQFGEQITPNFLKINAGLDMKLSSRLFVTLETHMAHTTEKVDQMYTTLLNSPWNDYLKGYAAGVRFNSVLGPLVIMVGDNLSDHKARWYVNLGYTF